MKDKDSIAKQWNIKLGAHCHGERQVLQHVLNTGHAEGWYDQALCCKDNQLAVTLGHSFVPLLITIPLWCLKLTCKNCSRFVNLLHG